MRAVVAAALVLSMMGSVGAAECPLSLAAYGQQGNERSLRFMPVPLDGAINQIAAFEITLPEARVLAGAIHIPNGFGQAWGSVKEKAAEMPAEEGEEDDEPPRLWEGVVYALIDGGIAELPHEPEQVAPQQILLPQFASSIWYSTLRDIAFDENNTLFDTFVFESCEEMQE